MTCHHKICNSKTPHKQKSPEYFIGCLSSASFYKRVWKWNIFIRRCRKLDDILCIRARCTWLNAIFEEKPGAGDAPIIQLPFNQLVSTLTQRCAAAQRFVGVF